MKKKIVLCLSTAIAILSMTACQSKPADTTTAASTAAESTTAESTTAETIAAETSIASNKTESEVAAKNDLVADLEQSDYKSFAKTVQKIVADKDIKALADSMIYPVYIKTEAKPDGILVENKDDVTGMADDIFTDAFEDTIGSVDAELLNVVQAGVMMGYDTGKAGAIIGIDESGKLGINNLCSVN